MFNTNKTEKVLISKILKSLLFFLLSVFFFHRDVNGQKTNFTGKYTGFLYQDDKNKPFFLEVEIMEKNRKTVGLATIQSGDSKVIFNLFFEFPRYGRDGRLELLSFEDESIYYEKGSSIWCRKRYRSTEVQFWEDSLVIVGNWSNVGTHMFENGVLNYSSKYGCSPGTFRISKPVNNRNLSYAISSSVNKCVSGDCQNGYGVSTDYLGIYEGYFSNSKRSGEGKYEYTKGKSKGVVYVGHFENDNFNGYGRITYPNFFKDYYEGEFKNGKYNGNGTLSSEGKIYRGKFSNYTFYGVGTRTFRGLSIIAYWNSLYPDSYKSLSYDVLKYHQDTMFANFTKCDCLTKKRTYVYANGLGSVPYNLVSSETGQVVGTTSEIEVVDKSFMTNGFINSSNHDIYIRCYRVFHYNDRNVDEYIDESYVVAPGEEILGNYRQKPQPGTLLTKFFKDNFIYVGQFCAKSSKGACH